MTDKSSSQLEPPPRWTPAELAGLAIQILLLHGQQKPPSITGLDDRTHDQPYHEALKRAEWMMREVTGVSDTPVHAYQLFTPGADPISPASAVKRFKEVGWKPDTGNTLFNNVIRPLLEKAVAKIAGQSHRFNAMTSAIAGEGFDALDFSRDKKLGTDINQLLSNKHLKLILDDQSSLANEIKALIIEKVAKALRKEKVAFDESGFADQCAYAGFMNYVASWYPELGGQAFRAHELFLFAAQTELFPEKLIKPRHELATDFIPDPPIKTHISILTCWNRSLTELHVAADSLAQE